MVWATVGEGDAAHEVVLQSVRLPQARPIERIAADINADARATLIRNGYPSSRASKARIHMEPLPSLQEVEAKLQPHLDAKDELVLADIVLWEACRMRLGLRPETIAGGDVEMDYKGLKIRRSAAS